MSKCVPDVIHRTEILLALPEMGAYYIRRTFAMTDTTLDFFETPREASKVKAQIVFKYVQSWGRVLSDYQRRIGRMPELAYVDLFSGPGMYGDGTSSTPMLVLKAAAEDSKIGNALRTFFNDLKEENVVALAEATAELPGIRALRFEPQRFNEEATLGLIKKMGIPSGIPRLYFLDQFGYKHVTLAMIQNLMDDWAECIFFFNYRRVIAAIDNPAMVQNMLALFGSAERLRALKDELAPARNASAREQVVMSHLIAVLRDAGVKHVQPFSFKVEDSQRSTHHLIFLSNHPKGYTIMRDIMAREGTQSKDGLPYLSYIQKQVPQSLDLFPVDWVAVLGAELCHQFQGQTLTLEELFVTHSPGNSFLPAHYKDALLRLENEGAIIADPKSDQRQIVRGMRTMAITTRVTFHGGPE
jgi:three-Cys-motif partner protein